MTKNKVNHTDSTPNLVSIDVGDFMTDGTIALFIILIGLFLAINFLDSKKNDRE